MDTTSLNDRNRQDAQDMPESGSDASTQDKSLSVEFGFLPVPRRVRYDPKSPPHFGVGMNLLLGLTATSGECSCFVALVFELISPQLLRTSTILNLYSVRFVQWRVAQITDDTSLLQLSLPTTSA